MTITAIAVVAAHFVVTLHGTFKGEQMFVFVVSQDTKAFQIENMQ